MASRIIGGFQNREQVSQAVNNPPPKPTAPKVEEMREQRPEQIDLGTYFKKLANQMDALTKSLKLQTQQQPQLQLQLLPELQAQLHALLQPQLQAQLMQNRNNVSFLLDRSDSSSVPSIDVAGNTVSSRLRENVKSLIDYMKLVNSELKNAVGIKPPPPRMPIAEEEEIRDAIQSLCRNMNRMSKELRCVLDENTSV
ncbi:unnamed protein product, partial [Ixodes persulcatus]